MKAKKKNVTDRAKRYRANAAIAKTGAARRCFICGNPDASDVEHVNGNEGDNRPQNLVHACRSCNVTKGKVFSDAGIGVKTVQYNPSSGASTLAQYLSAVMVLKGQGDSMSLPAAIKLIHNTSHAQRARFASQIWDKRRARA